MKRMTTEAKGFVHFEQIDVIDGHAVVCKDFLGHGTGPVSMMVGSVPILAWP